jgi:hypothetical protein
VGTTYRLPGFSELEGATPLGETQKRVEIVVNVVGFRFDDETINLKHNKRDTAQLAPQENMTRNFDVHLRSSGRT